MSQELIYTSAPRGLKPGSHGFCTVVQTQGITAALAQRLEALSGYRHLYSPPDPNARLNPVLASHLVFSLAGRRCHVLSRVCDAGLDHTQRTNKFAHHVVLDPSELGSAGPAWLLAAPGFMQASWDGVPRILPAGRQPLSGNSAAAVCRTWQQVMGDAGWGGALAETAWGGANRPAVVVFLPGFNPLPLLVESLALLPPESRWGVTFSTYFSKLPPGLDCQWRCVLAGTPEALAAQRTPGALVIDLARPSAAPAGGPLVQAARSGIAPAAAVPPARPQRPAVAGAYRASDAELAQLLPAAAAPHTASASAPSAGRAAAGLDSTEVEEIALGPPQRPISGLELPFLSGGRTRKRISAWPWVSGLAAIAGILLLGIGAAWIANNKAKRAPTSDAMPNPELAASDPSISSAAHGNPSAKTVESPSAPTKAPVSAIADKPNRSEQDKHEDNMSDIEGALTKCEMTAGVAKEQAEPQLGNVDSEKDNACKAAKRQDLQAIRKAAAAAAAAIEIISTKKKEALTAKAQADALISKLQSSPTAKAIASIGKIKSAADATAAMLSKAMQMKEEIDNYAVEIEAAEVKRNAFADSIRDLNGKVIDFPEAEKSDLSAHFIGSIPGLSGCEFSFTPIGVENVFPRGCSITVAKSAKHDDTYWYDCNITMQTAGGSSPCPENVLRYVVAGEKLSVKWTDNARSHYRESNQLRNCAWMISAPGIDPKATFYLGKPESTQVIKFRLPKGRSSSGKDAKTLELTPMLTDTSIAIEPLETQIIDGSSVWPVEIVGDLPDRSPTPTKQEWTLVVGKKDKGKVRFKLAAQKQKASVPPKLDVVLTFEVEDNDSIETIRESIAKCKSELAEKESRLKVAIREKQAQEKVDNLTHKINALTNQRATLESDLKALTSDLNQLRNAINGRPLRYQIVILLDGKMRVLYTTERQPLEAPKERRNTSWIPNHSIVTPVDSPLRIQPTRALPELVRRTHA